MEETELGWREGRGRRRISGGLAKWTRSRLGIIPHCHVAFRGAPTVKVARTTLDAAFCPFRGTADDETIWPRVCVVIDLEAGHVHVE